MMMETPLSKAASSSDWKTLRELLAAGANPNEAVTEIHEGLTINVYPLTYALINKGLDAARLLCEYGADPNLPWLYTYENGVYVEQYALYYAIQEKLGVELISALIYAKANPNQPRKEFLNGEIKNETNPLTVAVQHGNLEIVKLLLDAGADDNSRYCVKDADTGYRQSLLVAYQAASDRNYKVLQLLLARGANKEAMMMYGPGKGGDEPLSQNRVFCEALEVIKGLQKNEKVQDRLTQAQRQEGAKREYQIYSDKSRSAIRAFLVCIVLSLSAAAVLTFVRSIPERLQFPAGMVSAWFETGNIRAGGQMLEVHKLGSDMLNYANRAEKFPYEAYGIGGFLSKLFGFKIRAESPGVLCGEYIMAADGDTVQVSNFHEGMKTFGYEPKKVTRADGTYDYGLIYDLLVLQESKPIPLEDAATILTLIKEGVILGYRDGKAVFVRDDGNMKAVIYWTPEKSTEVSFTKDGTVPMMAAGNLLLYVSDRGPNVLDLETGNNQYYPLSQYASGQWREGEDILAQNYRFEPEFGQVSLIYVTDNHFFKIIYAQDAVNRYSVKEVAFDSPPTSLYVSGNMAYAVMARNDVHWYEIPSVPEFEN